MEMNAEQMQNKAREHLAQLGPQLDEARRNLVDFNTRTVAFIRENPGTCLLGAVALGFLVGKLASR
jgi:ElaB/YqjD/DUF883 family membrane-anchored ribosome-binding protein